jgi:enoyl-CoA hydratase/carnithine racemase
MGQIQMQRHDGVAQFTLDAPPMNPLDRAMIGQLETLLAQCRDDPTVRSLVLHGAGARAFSAGSDLNELRTLIAQGREALAAKFAQDHHVFGALAHFPKPTLAAIEGLAAGGGLELAVCCDLVIAGRGARLSLPEIHLGAFPGSGGTVRVTRRVGPGRAHRLMLLGEPVDAPTALGWGLVDELTDDGAALDQALRLAARMAQGPARAYQGCKESLAAALDGPDDAAHGIARRWAVELGFSDDLTEGLRAFDEKRRPRFGQGH